MVVVICLDSDLGLEEHDRAMLLIEKLIEDHSSVEHRGFQQPSI